MDLLPWQNCRRVKSTWHRFTVASGGEGREGGGSEAIGTRPRYAYSERCKVRCSRVTLCPLRPRVRLRFRTRLGWTNVLILSHLALSYLRAGGNYSLQGWIGEWRIDFGGGRGYGRRGTTTFETESELSRDQNVKVQLGKGGQTLLPRLAAHPPLALCAYLYIRTCMHGRPIILFSSLILFQIHFDRFPTCFPSSTRKIVSFEKSREKLDGFDRWFSSFFFLFSFPRVFFSHKSDGPSRRRGGRG